MSKTRFHRRKKGRQLKSRFSRWRSKRKTQYSKRRRPAKRSYIIGSHLPDPQLPSDHLPG